MKDDDRAIVNPVKSKSSPELPDFAVMTGSQTDLKLMCNLLDLNEKSRRELYHSNLYHTEFFSLAGPMIGAPYAVMILETLLAWGAKKVLFYGWCGAISEDMEIGTILIPTGAYIDEGTSKHYDFPSNQDFIEPSHVLTEIVQEVFDQKKIPFKEGIIWTTDAIYRETPRKVSKYLSKNAVAVEMELSALFTVGKFRKAEISAILVVSDDLSGDSWRPGFRAKPFKNSRKLVGHAIRHICREYE
jgi:uridine phosphorylase